jgi:D-alanyl-D-alanine carboxypeptidase (penicillin-binding protein 5/6)
LAVVTALSGAAPAAQAQIPYLQMLPQLQTKYAAIVVDAKTGEVLYAKRADSPRYPASITKVMTLYLTFEALASGKLHLDDRVPFSPHAAAQAPSKLGVRAGDSISVSEAMQAMAIKSANDAAVAMAEKLGGTESRFAALMTLRAQELGMQNTRFVNASGLPDSRQVTAARDIAIMSRAVMRDYPQYYRLFSQQDFTFRGQLISNHNHLLGRMPGVDGLKTGFTNASGFNIAVSAVRDNRRLIVVVMGGPTTALRDQNAEDLLLTGFEVMNRRARGEKITVAQNLFEPEPNGPVERPPIEQGDGDQDGLKIVLASAAPMPHAASRIQIVEPPKKAAAKSGAWVVQVGAFPSRAGAREQIALVSRRFGKHLDGARGVAEAAGGKYRARFGGLTEAQARDACKAVKAKRLACMVIAPG